MSAEKFNPKVDAYFLQAAPFAQTILVHLRELIHKACGDVVEEMKWSRPFFLHGGVILCNISAFKQHCSFGFWGAEIGKVLRADGVVQDGGMGSLGKITKLSDLPSDKAMLGYLRLAVALIDDGKGDNRVVVARRVVKAPKAAVEIPTDLAAALRKNSAASKTFAAFSSSCRREYVGWIVEAKREETRQKRIAQAVEWIAEGKQRNWKYQAC